MLVKTIKTIDLINNFKRVSDWLEENSKEWITISRPKNKNIVLMTEAQANELARAKRNLEYLAMLDESIEDAKENGAYEYFGNGKFSDTPIKINI